jgi:hypothetical protein
MRVELSRERLQSGGGESIGANVPADVGEGVEIGGNGGYSLEILGTDDVGRMEFEGLRCR